jgi:hypothetical protein
VIFEVANEPDMIQTDIQESDVLSWEEDMVAKIRHCDLPNHHLIQINGHHLDSSGGTFAWSTSGSGAADLASAHYAFFNPSTGSGLKYWTPTFYGALDQLQKLTPNPPSTAPNVALQPLAFNEDLGLPDLQYPATDGNRLDQDVRSEALEFITSGGGPFDGFSDQYGSTALQLNNELKNVAKVLIPGGAGVNWFDGMQPASCCVKGNTCGISPNGPWCWNLPKYSDPDPGSCSNTGAQIYYSTIANTGQYQGIPAADALLYVHHGQQVFASKIPISTPNWAGGYHAIPCPTSGTLV